MAPRVTHTLQTILARTDEVGECLEWQGFTSADGAPQVKIDGKLLMVRRVIREMLDKPAAPGHFLAPSCGNARCVHPEHVVERTARQHAQRMAASVTRNSPTRIARLQRANKHKRALSDEGLELARHDPRSAAAVARELGCSRDLVSSIRNGRAYRQVSAAENPFAQLIAYCRK